MPAGPYVAKADAATGKADLAHLPRQPQRLGPLDRQRQPQHPRQRQHRLRLVEPDRADRRRHRPDPEAQHAARRRGADRRTSNFKHLTIAPDRTLIMKDQTRPIGCTLQGTMAIIKCVQKGMKQPNSVLVAVEPDTLEVLDMLAAARAGAVAAHRHDVRGQDRASTSAWTTSARRYFWDPATKKLSADESWVIYPIAEGPDHRHRAEHRSATGSRSSSTAPAARRSASSIVVASQKDAKKTSDLPLRPAEEGRVELRAAEGRRRPRERHDLLGRHGPRQGGRHQARPGHRRAEGRLRASTT